MFYNSFTPSVENDECCHGRTNMYAVKGPNTAISIPGLIESSSLGQDLLIFNCVLQAFGSRVLSRLRHTNRKDVCSIMFYIDLIPGRIESSSLGQELRVFHYVV